MLFKYRGALMEPLNSIFSLSIAVYLVPCVYNTGPGRVLVNLWKG